MTEPTTGPVDPDPRAQEREELAPTGPVIRDKRRLDPKTGQVRASAEAPTQPPARDQGEDAAYPSSTSASTEEEPGQSHPDTRLAADRLEDLRRLQAEFVNYKRRVDRDRARDREVAVGGVVEALLPLLDDIHSAREHGDLTEGPFAAIADKLEATLSRFGVERFGAAGEAFDPTLHEALMHVPGADLPEGSTETTIVQVVQPGFRVGERLVRPARVAVADP